VKIDSALQNITHLFLDTAPVIYYVEKNPHYFGISEFVFDEIDNERYRRSHKTHEVSHVV
jgi:hypothetical protein